MRCHIVHIHDMTRRFKWGRITGVFSGEPLVAVCTSQRRRRARAIYQRCGFVKVAEKPHRDFGVGLVGETWEMEP
jgi:hypothetical protein